MLRVQQDQQDQLVTQVLRVQRETLVVQEQLVHKVLKVIKVL